MGLDDFGPVVNLLNLIDDQQRLVRSGCLESESGGFPLLGDSGEISGTHRVGRYVLAGKVELVDELADHGGFPDLSWSNKHLDESPGFANARIKGL